MEPKSSEAISVPTLSALCLNSAAILDRGIVSAETSDFGHLTLTLRDERGRLSVWASNLGVPQPADSPKSLDHRLRDARLMRRSVVSGLERLQVSAQRALAILDGSAPNRCAPPVSDSNEATSELDELMLSIHSAISHLFSLSMLIRRHRPRGRLPNLGDFTPLESSPDISNVMDKFPKVRANMWLARRLGNGITQRREILRYRQIHRQSLGKKVEKADGLSDAATLAATVVATTFQEVDHLHPTTTAPGQDHAPNSRVSILTSATSFLSLDESEGLGRGIPDLSDMTLDGIQLQYDEPFECPYCRTIQLVRNRYEWKRHVFMDLKPYICTSENCMDSSKPFPTRAEWLQHEFNGHHREWICNWCHARPEAIFSSEKALTRHLDKVHPEMATQAQMPLILDMCERPIQTFTSSSCLLCSEWKPLPPQNNANGFSRHLARHLQVLALEALPLAIEGLEVKDERGSSDEIAPIGDDESADDAAILEVSSSIFSTESAGGGSGGVDGPATLPEGRKLPDSSKVRTWTDRTKQFKVEAQFLGLTDDDKFLLHKMNGVKIAVPLSKMSREDLEYFENLTGISLQDDKPLADVK